MDDGTVTSGLPLLVDELLMLIHETAEYQRNRAVQEILCEARQVALNVRRRLLGGISRYVVALVGLTNVGKSTLLNALLGHDLAPRRNGPCTAVPIEFIYGDELRLSVVHQKSLHRPSWACPRVEVIHQRLRELADDQGRQASPSIRKVVVEIPHRLLARGVVIADTPGFGDVPIGDAARGHEEVLQTYLHNDVTQVFWVVLAEQGIGRREKDFHRQFLSDICDDVLVTGSEGWEPVDRDRFRQRFAQELGQRLPRFHFVSGLQGLQARRAKDLAGLKQAGIVGLQLRLAELADPRGRQKAQIADLLQLAGDLAQWVRDFRDDRDLPIVHFWRPDSWERWLSLAPNGEPKTMLTQLLEVKA
jgi:hypothetical protein